MRYSIALRRLTIVRRSKGRPNSIGGKKWRLVRLGSRYTTCSRMLWKTVREPHSDDQRPYICSIKYDPRLLNAI
jgi:hypothetical protein